MNLGGPVWHASVAFLPSFRQSIAEDRLQLEEVARAVLEGVGDASLGEWPEEGGIAFHLRRRLSSKEAAVVGPVVDIRGTPEMARRLALVRQRYPWAPAE